jgi:hypothetical protein
MVVLHSLLMQVFRYKCELMKNLMKLDAAIEQIAPLNIPRTGLETDYCLISYKDSISRFRPM